MKSKSGIVTVVVLAAFAAIVLYFTFGGEGGDPVTEQQAEVPAAQQVSAEPYLTGLTDLTGKPVDMEKDKVIFLNVWATWCGPCVMEMPGIQKLYERYKSNDKVRFYIVSDEDAETINPFVARKGYQLPFYIYQNMYPPVLDGNAIPRSYIIHKGRILTQMIGAADWDTPETYAVIDKALQDS